MGKTIYLFIASGLVILLGTFVMYSVELQVPNSKIKTLLDALWWCVATVTTVGYGDIVPVSKHRTNSSIILYVLWHIYDSNPIVRHYQHFL